MSTTSSIFNLNLHKGKLQIEHPTSSFFFDHGDLISPEPCLFDARTEFARASGFSRNITTWKLNSALKEGQSYPDSVDIFASILSGSIYDRSDVDTFKVSSYANQKFLIGLVHGSPACEFLVVKNSLLRFMLEEENIDIFPLISRQGSLWNRPYGQLTKLRSETKKAKSKTLLDQSDPKSCRLLKAAHLSKTDLKKILASQEVLLQKGGELIPAHVACMLKSSVFFTKDATMKFGHVSTALWIRQGQKGDVIGVCATNSVPRSEDIELAKWKEVKCISPTPFYRKASRDER